MILKNKATLKNFYKRSGKTFCVTYTNLYFYTKKAEQFELLTKSQGFSLFNFLCVFYKKLA